MIYKAPEMDIVLFDSKNVITASEDEGVTTTTQKTTGAGGGVVLPDDNWIDVL